MIVGGAYIVGMSKKIKILLTEKEITLSELAEKIGTSQPNLSNKMQRDNFSEKDLIKIAEILDVKYEGFFFLENGDKI